MDIQEQIKKRTAEERRGMNTGVWLRKWLEIYSGVIANSAKLYWTNAALLFGAGALVLLGTVFSAAILTGPLFVGMFIIVFAVGDSKPADLNMLKAGFNDAFTTILAGLIFSAVLFFGYLFFARVPLIGVLFAYIFLLLGHSLLWLVLPSIARSSLKLVPALGEGITMAREHWLPYAAFSVVALIAGLCGIVIFYFGIIFTVPLYFCLIAAFYRHAERNRPATTLRENIPLRRG